jgi:hypothetical protein
MVQTTQGNTLVANAIGSPPAATTMQIRVIRSFLYAGAPAVAGTVLEVPGPVARELIAMGKAAEHEITEASPEPVDDAIELEADGPVEPARPRRGRPPKPKE